MDVTVFITGPPHNAVVRTLARELRGAGAGGGSSGSGSDAKSKGSGQREQQQGTGTAPGRTLRAMSGGSFPLQALHGNRNASTANILVQNLWTPVSMESKDRAPHTLLPGDASDGRGRSGGGGGGGDRDRAVVGGPLFSVTVGRGETAEEFQTLLAWVIGSVKQATGRVVSHGRHTTVHSQLPTVGETSLREKKGMKNDSAAADDQESMQSGLWGGVMQDETLPPWPEDDGGPPPPALRYVRATIMPPADPLDGDGSEEAAAGRKVLMSDMGGLFHFIMCERSRATDTNGHATGSGNPKPKGNTTGNSQGTTTSAVVAQDNQGGLPSSPSPSSSLPSARTRSPSSPTKAKAKAKAKANGMGGAAVARAEGLWQWPWLGEASNVRDFLGMGYTLGQVEEVTSQVFCIPTQHMKHRHTQPGSSPFLAKAKKAVAAQQAVAARRHAEPSTTSREQSNPMETTLGSLGGSELGNTLASQSFNTTPKPGADAVVAGGTMQAVAKRGHADNDRKQQRRNDAGKIDPTRRVLVAVERVTTRGGLAPKSRVEIRIEGGDRRDVEVIARMLILGSMMIHSQSQSARSPQPSSHHPLAVALPGGAMPTPQQLAQAQTATTQHAGGRGGEDTSTTMPYLNPWRHQAGGRGSPTRGSPTRAAQP